MERVYEFNITHATLGDALKELAQQSDKSLFFPNVLAGEQNVRPVIGKYSVDEALKLMLRDTELSGSLIDGALISVSLAPNGNEQFREEKMASGNIKKGLLASASALMFGVGGTALAQDEAGAAGEEVRDTITVTATKRETGLQDTAMSISVLGNDTIDKRNLVGMEDYLNSLPSTSVLPAGPGLSIVVVRGLTASPQFEAVESSPVSGVYFGETPVSSLGYNGNPPDLKLVDMERVEVLRGPQGTLYGAGAMSGVVRNIPNAPDLSEFGGSIKLGYSNTEDKGSHNYSASAVVNVPLVEDILGLRVAAYRFDDSGYYENIGVLDPAARASGAVTNFGAVLPSPQDNIGATDTKGLRASILWRPTESLSANLSYLNQQSDQFGSATAEFDLPGGFSQSRISLRTREDGAVDQPERQANSTQLANLTADYNFGWGVLTSSTSWAEADSDLVAEVGAFFGDALPLTQDIPISTSLLSEELRLATNFDAPIQFIGGIFYEDRQTIAINNTFFGGADLSDNPGLLGLPAGEARLLENFFQRDIKQIAYFGELSYEVFDNLTLMFGGRAFEYDREFLNIRRLTGTLVSDIESEESGTSFKASIDYKPTESVLLYASWAEGFRLGYAEPAKPPDTVARCDVDGDGFFDDAPDVSLDARNIDSDFLDNYELGAKVTLLDNRLNVNTAVYQTDWEGIPLLFGFGDQGCSATVNAGTARSRGFELETSFDWTENLSVRASMSYVNAELTSDVNGLGAVAGDRLPGSPEWNASFGAEYRFRLMNHDAYIRSDYYYVGGFFGAVPPAGTQAGDYSRLNAKAGIVVDDVTFDVFVDNLTNDDGITWLDQRLRDNRGYRLRPRTIGVNIGYRF